MVVMPSALPKQLSAQWDAQQLGSAVSACVMKIMLSGPDLRPDSKVFVISEKGFGKQTPASEYPIKGRGGKGIKTTNITAKNGNLAGMTTVNGDEDIMVITDKGVMIRFNLANVSQTGRATLGVKLINLDDDAQGFNDG